MNITLPDEKIEDVIISQYTYIVYAGYDVILSIRDKKDLEKLITYNDKKILLFVKNPEYIVEAELFHKLNLKCIYFGRKNWNIKNFDFSVSENLALNYICYLENEFPKTVFSDKDREEILRISGYNFYNIYQIMQLCYFNQVTVEQIRSRGFVDIAKEDKDISIILNLCSKGIHINAIRKLIGDAKAEEYIMKKYIFLNGEYAIPNVEFKLKYKSEPDSLNENWWKNILAYVQTIKAAHDVTICQQVEWNLRNIIQLDIQNDSLNGYLYKIERILFKIYRFRENSVLLDMLKECKTFFKRDKEKWIRCLVDEATLYMDIEEFKVSKEKFEQALESCKENSVRKEVQILVEDEYSRVLEKTGHYYEAVNKLYVVEQYYQEVKNEKKLNNVKNRIGLNLSFIGDIERATEYLESLLFGNFNKKIDRNNILSCEVANNLSLCYMEAGLYKKALRLQNLLYQLYLRTQDTPINYATDILQNKGNIYLYEHKYYEAFGANENSDGIVSVGEAAHICAASPGGKRYNSNMTSEERASIDNGIWLCRNCAAMIDRDEEYFSVELLQAWKRLAEIEANQNIISNRNYENKIELCTNDRNVVQHIIGIVENTPNTIYMLKDHNYHEDFQRSNLKPLFSLIDFLSLPSSNIENNQLRKQVQMFGESVSEFRVFIALKGGPAKYGNDSFIIDFEEDQEKGNRLCDLIWKRYKQMVRVYRMFD